MNHYTYMLKVKEPTDARSLYIGVRTCKTQPELDAAYLGSCKSLKEWIKTNGADKVEKIILSRWPTREEALAHEIFLHDCFEVNRNDEFWNKAKQTAIGFDRSGATQVPWNKGVKASVEHRAKISAGLRRSIDALVALNVPHWNTGKQSPNKGKTAPVEVREKISAARLGKRNSTKTEFKKGCRVGAKWFNNGEYENLYIPGEQPDGFSKGRKPKCQK